MLYQDIHNDFIQARKDRDDVKKSVLQFLYDILNKKTIELRTETLSDADTLSLIQKFIKQLDEEIGCNITAGREEKVKELKTQKEIVEQYLPKQMSEDEIRAEISKLEDKKIPSVMKHFKANFAGKCDMGLVSKIAKEYM